MAKPYLYFTDQESFRTVDILRIVYAVIAVIAFFATEAGRHLYRPYIYSHHINDWGFADSIGNSGGIVVQIFFTLAVINSSKRKAWHVFGFIIVGYILYEFLQLYLPRGTFDWNDIYGTLVGGAITIILWLVIKVLVKNKVIYKF